MYADLTDEELNAKVSELRDAIEKVSLGGAVAVIAGEGRRVEYTRANSEGLNSLYRLAIIEVEKRANGGRVGGRALGVRFTR